MPDRDRRYERGSHRRAAEAALAADREALSDQDASRWSRLHIERFWDALGSLHFDRESMYHDEGADSEFCEMHRRALADVLDRAQVVPGAVHEIIVSALNDIRAERDRYQDALLDIADETNMVRSAPVTGERYIDAGYAARIAKSALSSDDINLAPEEGTNA